jgi:hypothetical protein
VTTGKKANKRKTGKAGSRVVIRLDKGQGYFDRMPVEMKVHILKVFGAKAGLNPPPGPYEGPPIESAKEYYARHQQKPREVKARHPLVHPLEDIRPRVPRLISVLIVPRKGPLFYGMQLTAYTGTFDDGSRELIANSAYELDGIVQIASKRARKGYKFELARRGYPFGLSERDKKNAIAIVSIGNDFMIPEL